MLQVDAYVKLVDPDFDKDAQRDMIHTIASLQEDIPVSSWGMHALELMHKRHWRLASIIMQQHFSHKVLQNGLSPASSYIKFVILMSSQNTRLVMETLAFLHAEYMQHYSQDEWLKILTEVADEACITPHMQCAALGLFDSPR